ncbi:integrase family protein [Polaromonas sp. JS666]|uniref:integrase family protein n=1 Tax=Polaromonas sp. (strain JS666 / ATCC BAA-500) TaxID=296591 RepID=UPI0000535379|nr:integrase family protein [Polaromonas sp. JS666]ABE43472.1 phage integrase [Polaromonas sp. JS666]
MARIAFTAGRVAGFKCPPEKSQVFLWDAATPGLGLRTTAAGKPSYVFQGRYQEKTIRVTIGSPDAWSIPQAQEKARALQRLIDEGRDPRDLKRDAVAAGAERKAAAAAKVQADKVASLTVGEVWQTYLQEGKPKRRDAWKPGYRADLELMATPGGVKKKRGQGLTRQGPIYPLLALQMTEVNEDALKAWFDRESLAGKHQAARAFMMFKGFLRWCSARPAYRSLIDRDAGKAAAIVENLPQATHRTDKLLKGQVQGWWTGVEQLSNRTASVYLRALLLTGARREEVAALKWGDVDFQWRKLTLADKVDATRTIPLSPYMAHMLAGLPRVGAFVFASASKSGHIVDARDSMQKAVTEAEVGHLTFHGLRRTFTQTGRGVVPAGIVAQIQGHKSSATAEGYDIRTLDELSPYLEQIERHILSLAGVQFDAGAVPGALRVVNG